jgi:DNA polymerase I
MTTGAGLTVIDLNAMMHRYYAAVSPRFRQADGQPTNALYGLCGFLAREKWTPQGRPTHMAAVFDSPRTWRHETSPDYKANRKPKPQPLKDQFFLAKVACRMFGAHPIEIDRLEADDVIAALASTFPGPVSIWSNDNDLMQLVTRDGRVTMFDWFANGGPRHIGVAEVEAKFHGLKIEQIVDCKSIAGDGGDGVKGIPRIGLKIAATILHKFGTLEAAIQNSNEIEGDFVRQQFQLHYAKAKAAKTLIKLNIKVPDLPFPLHLTFRPRSSEIIAEFLENLEFPDLAQRYRPEDAA